MSYLDEVRQAMEDQLGKELPTEEDVKRAYGEFTGFQGDMLDREFAIATGQAPGVSVLAPDGELVRRPTDPFDYEFD